MKPDPALSWKSGPWGACGMRGKNCSNPGGSWSCGRCSRFSVLPDLMKTTLGFTCSATEANASLRLARAATPAGDAAAAGVDTAGELGCWAEEKFGRWSRPAKTRPARNASPTPADRMRCNHPCDMFVRLLRRDARGGIEPRMCVGCTSDAGGRTRGSIALDHDGGSAVRAPGQDERGGHDDGEGKAEDVPHGGLPSSGG